MCLEKEIDQDYQLILNDFERNFDYLYENIELNMTLKVLVILSENHGYKVVRKLGSQTHLKKSKKSLITFNSKRAGFSPASDLTLRKTPSPYPSYSSPLVQ